MASTVAITTGRAEIRQKDNGGGGGGGHRKLLTKAAAHQIFWTRHRGGARAAAAVICILTFAIKIVATTGNAIPNIDHQIIINDTTWSDNSTGSTTTNSSSPVHDLSFLRPQNQDLLNQTGQQQSGGSSSDANGIILTGGGGGAFSPSSSSSILGRAATYSYYYIGRKLMYVPLFFLLYWTFYNMYLLAQAVSSRWVSRPLLLGN